MKEIFNDIRKEIDIHSDEACFMPDDMMVVSESWMLKKLDEAEAKWESDCCEWKQAYNSVYEAHGEHFVLDVLQKWSVCPYCGKPIKISEVE